MLPVLLTQTIILFQDTSLVYAIGAYDLLKGFDLVARTWAGRWRPTCWPPCLLRDLLQPEHDGAPAAGQDRHHSLKVAPP
jgi:hypothetical protein